MLLSAGTSAIASGLTYIKEFMPMLLRVGVVVGIIYVAKLIFFFWTGLARGEGAGIGQEVGLGDIEHDRHLRRF